MIFEPQMEFIVNLTFRCNLKCKMCSQYGDGFKDSFGYEMSFDEWKSFFVSISEAEPKPKLILMGGEPFLNKYFRELFVLIQELGFEVHIISNGLLLDKFIDLLAPTDVNITISIDGLKETHDKIRGMNGLFDKVIDNIKKIEKVQKNGSKIKLRINSVLLPENIDNTLNFIKYIEQFNIENYTLQHLQFSNPELVYHTRKEFVRRLDMKFDEGFVSASANDITPEYLKKLKATLKNIKQKWKVPGFVFPALSEDELEDYYYERNLSEMRKGRICLNSWMTPTINPDGNVYNCITEPLGNLREQDFWEIWNNEKSNRFRQNLIEDGKFDFCNKCCNFYKGNFISSPNGILKLKSGKSIILPDIVNFVISSQEGVFILDKNREIVDNVFPVIPVDIHSEQMLNEIKEKETIVGLFSEIL